VGKLELSAWFYIHMHMASTWSNIGHVGKMEIYTWKRALRGVAATEQGLFLKQICVRIKTGAVSKSGKRKASATGTINEKEMLVSPFLAYVTK
jgi:hypothetical protein